jgi:hypothetical protein
MADPILDGHRLLESLYLLGSPLTPISIRDQMLRARWLIDRLILNKHLKAGGRMLIVGAGAAGATAAIRAAQHSVYALLVEQSGGAFSVQAGSNTRWIDPAQYDWPAAHWAAQAYPWRPPRMPLGFRADYASALAQQWDTLLHRHIAIQRPRLSFQRNLRVAGLVPMPGVRQLKVLFIRRSGQQISFDFDLVVWAVGFGQEKTSISTPSGGVLSGLRFWATDKVVEPNCGLSSLPDVLILGSGDGALQDFLRVATALPSALEIYNKLSVPQFVANISQDIEAEFHRGLVWCNREPDEERLYAVRHEAYGKLVEDLWRDTAFRNRAHSLLRQDVQTIAVAFPSIYLTGFYGLNCLLARVLVLRVIIK